MFTFRETVGLPGMTWCLRFNETNFAAWKDAFTIHMWEGKNRTSFAKAKLDEQRYIQDAYEDVDMSESDDPEGGYEEEEEDGSILDEAVPVEEPQEEDDEDDIENQGSFNNGIKNEQLAVGYKSDLSFVGRGSMIGVFTHKDDKMRFRTAINKVQDTKGNSFAPSKVGGDGFDCWAHER